MLRNLFAKIQPHNRGSENATCERVQSTLLPYIDGDLRPAEQSFFDTHLDQCAACRAELAAHRRAETVLGTAAASIASPGDMRAEFYVRLEQSNRRSLPITWKLAAPALAGVAVLWFFVGNGPKVQTLPTMGGAMARPHEETIAKSGLRGDRRPIVPPVAAKPGTKLDADSEHVALTYNTRANRLRQNDSRSNLERVGLRPIRRSNSRHELIVKNSVRYTNPFSVLTTIVHAPAAGTSNHQVSIARVVPNGRGVQDQDSARYAARDSGSEGMALGYKSGGPVLASLTTETELHVSDEARDFMASTHVGPAASRQYKREALRVDDESEIAPEPVELPALP